VVLVTVPCSPVSHRMPSPGIGMMVYPAVPLAAVLMVAKNLSRRPTLADNYRTGITIVNRIDRFDPCALNSVVVLVLKNYPLMSAVLSLVRHIALSAF
jgi:hypothetical protein